jgi:hypothetical protein
MTIRSIAPAVMALAGIGGAAGPARAQAVDWFSIDCGGATSPATGGGLSLAGTIGQFDSTGGGGPVIGGFWAVVPPCTADFNQSGVISVQDIFDFLAAYFAGNPRADFNYSGVISVQDIFDFLAAYFAGC